MIFWAIVPAVGAVAAFVMVRTVVAIARLVRDLLRDD